MRPLFFVRSGKADGSYEHTDWYSADPDTGITTLGDLAFLCYLTANLADMTENMQFIPLTSPADRDWAAAWELYLQAFPPKERRTEADHLRALADPRFHADAIRRSDRFVGILYWWQGPAFRYVEYLAIRPDLRGQQLGSAIFGAFCRGERVILEIDPPEDEISVRRLGFYRRLGFHDCPLEYVHPSYSRPFEPHRLVLMGYPTPLDVREARTLADFVREEVLRYTEHEQPALPRIP